MIFKYTPWLICGTFILGGTPAFGSGGGFVNGQVVNGKTGVAINEATIILYITPRFISSGSELPVPVDTGYSDSIGAYTFENLAPDINYRLVADAPGFKSADQNFRLHHSPEAYIDLLLEEAQKPSGVILTYHEVFQNTVFDLDQAGLVTGKIKIRGPESGYLVQVLNLKGQIHFSSLSHKEGFTHFLSPKFKGKAWVLSLKTKNLKFSKIFSF